MSGVTTYRVVDPEFPWELHKQLLAAAGDHVSATFRAVWVDDPQETPEPRTFTVRVRVAHFDRPEDFEVTYEDENGQKRELLIQFPDQGQVEFNLYS